MWEGEGRGELSQSVRSRNRSFLMQGVELSQAVFFIRTGQGPFRDFVLSLMGGHVPIPVTFFVWKEVVMCQLQCFSCSWWQLGSCSLPAWAQRGLQGVGYADLCHFALCIWVFQSSSWSYRGIEASAKWPWQFLELALGFMCSNPLQRVSHILMVLLTLCPAPEMFWIQWAAVSDSFEIKTWSICSQEQ